MSITFKYMGTNLLKMCSHCFMHTGTLYTRWGHDSCPATASLIYKGSMAGSHHRHGGSSSNHLCLPFNPQYVPGLNANSGAYLCGSEYRVASQLNVGNREVHNRNIPCAVCQVQTRSTALMVPAHSTCPYGWTREYHGFVLGAHYTYTKREHICVDREMKTLPGYPGNEDGNLLYSASVKCNGLDCPPFQAEKPITCVMCTK